MNRRVLALPVSWSLPALAAALLLAGCPSSSPPSVRDALALEDLPADGIASDAGELPDGGGPCRVKADCPDGLVCREGTCQAGLSCAEAVQAMMSMSVSPDQAAAGVSQLLAGPAAVTFQALLDCAEEACGPIGDWNGYGCAVQTAFQDRCQEQYRECVTCQPACGDRVCGGDGCGGSCGTCPGATTCQDGTCVGCTGSCLGKECGDDGCGGSCGLCPGGLACVQGRCGGSCEPDCEGRQCGPDGCEGSCGTCDDGTWCGADATCVPVCVRQCAGKACGPDGCGGACGACGQDQFCDGTACVPFRSCADLFQCWSGCNATDQGCIDRCWDEAAPEAQAQYEDLVQCLVQACGTEGSDACYSQAYHGACKGPYQACLACTPNCTGRQCGPDGCGDLCGTCPGNGACDHAGLCSCVASCKGRECGPDGCGGLCGFCDAGELCSAEGRCACTPTCTGRECGGDGCGGSCGTCPTGAACQAGRCVTTCTPSCRNPDGTLRQCGGDGCGGSCGTCPTGATCKSGTCVTTCTPSCVTADGQQKQCGTDGCGGSCGTCKEGSLCQAGRCVATCTPSCRSSDGTLRQCGGDGCGGSCGTCPAGSACQAGRCVGTCTPQCRQPNGIRKECGDDGCGGQCGYCADGLSCTDGTCVAPLDCYDLMMCLSGCGEDDSACFETCYRRASPTAKAQYLEIYYCVEDQCGQAWDDACTAKALQGACKAPYQKCLACTPTCSGKSCGDDGCGGSCGSCPAGSYCDGRSCIYTCHPRCEGRECGDDGCGGQCGWCPDNAWCDGSRCVPWCEPRCEGRQCGDDGCGGQCGWCPDGWACSPDGYCKPGGGGDGCTARDTPGCANCACEECVCGQDPYCCQTAWDAVCVQECGNCGGCNACEPSCTTPWGTRLQCGDDGCGGQCGYCPPGTTCGSDGTCGVTPYQTCSGMVECAYGCPGFDPGCVQGCMSGGSSESQQLFWDLANCVMQVCGLPPDEACLQKAASGPCAQAYLSCRMDGQYIPM